MLCIWTGLLKDSSLVTVNLVGRLSPTSMRDDDGEGDHLDLITDTVQGKFHDLWIIRNFNHSREPESSCKPGLDQQMLLYVQ